jgi:hypothetical protein
MKTVFSIGHFITLVTFTFFLSATTASAFALVHEAWEEKVRDAIFKIADTDFEEGLEMLDAYIKAHPKTPEGYFLYAVGIQEKIQKSNDLKDLPRFYSYANRCKVLAKKALNKNKKDPVARFTLGTINAYIGLLEAKQRNLVSAFLSVRSATKILEKLTEERFPTRILPSAWSTTSPAEKAPRREEWWRG